MSNIRSIKLQPLIRNTLPLLLVAFGWYTVYSLATRLESNVIDTYQKAELEVVRNAARAATVYITGEMERRGSDPDTITQIEQEVLNEFVKPIRIGTVGDAWIYSPDYIVFDLSEDLPDKYRDKNMAEIFAIQQADGAFHYEYMATSVCNGQEGVGWYVFWPDKSEEAASAWEFLTHDAGREIAAWTPVVVFPGTDKELIWVIGMSAMLPELMQISGAYDQIRNAMLLMTVITALVLGLLYFLHRAERQVTALRQQVRVLEIQIDEARKASDVSEIVESEYFQDLAAKAKALRSARR
ncbi:MAG: hypothetical protein JXJ20_02430 [Anaerolineae bacterium]|nr:hypothetical protein [Anaerolineae bacterium]